MASLTYANIETRVANSLRISTSNSTEMTKLAAVINNIYREIYLKGDGQWWWLRKRAVLATRADITTGSALVTNDSTGVTLTDGPAVSVVGAKFFVPTNAIDPALYRVATHSNGSTSVTLDGVYTGGTDTAAAYHLWFDEISVATDVGKLEAVWRHGNPRPLQIIGPQDMYDLKIYDRRVGTPQVAALIDFATTGDPTTAQRLVLHPFPDEIYRLEYHYFQTANTELSSSTRPLIPDDYVEILVYGALAAGYTIWLNDATRAAIFQRKYEDTLNLMLAQQRRHQGNPQVVVQDHYRGFYRRGRRATPQTADLGSYFDRYPA